MILKRSELDNARSHSNGKFVDIKDSQAERSQLLEKSKSRTKEWRNITAGQRALKIADFEARKQQEEAERVRVDKAWAIIKEQERLDTLKQAKMMQFAQTDRARVLHSDILHRNVMKERELQIAKKSQKKQLAKDKDRSIVEVPIVDRLPSASSNHDSIVARVREQGLAEMNTANLELIKARDERLRNEKEQTRLQAEEILRSAREKAISDKARSEARSEEVRLRLLAENQAIIQQRSLINATERAYDEKLRGDIEQFQARKDWEKSMITSRLAEFHNEALSNQEKAASACIEGRDKLDRKLRMFLEDYTNPEKNLIANLTKKPEKGRDGLPAQTIAPKVVRNNDALKATRDKIQEDIDADLREKESKKLQAKMNALKLQEYNFEMADKKRERLRLLDNEDNVLEREIYEQARAEDVAFEEYKLALEAVMEKYV